MKKFFTTLSWFIMGIWIFHVLFLGTSVHAFEIPSLRPTGYVNDFASLLSIDEKKSIEEKLATFHTETSNEIVVVTIPSLDTLPIEMYANKLFRDWGIGDKDRNNGVLLLIARDDHSMRIEVGYGLEGAIPDVLTKRIQEDEMIPLFREGNYHEGILRGVDALLQASRGEYTALPQKNKKTFPMEVVYFVAFFGIQILRMILAPTKSWWLGGVVGGSLGGVIGYLGGALLWGGIGLAAGSIIGLVADYFFSKQYQQNINNPSRGDNNTPGPFGGFGGGFWGSGGSSGGGFGGFGGGSSGGGGSSSSW